jgi:zinc protease
MVSVMKRWRKAMIGLAGCCALAPGVAMAQPVRQAQGKQAAQPTAEQLIAKYVRSIGGRAAIEKVRSRVTVGTMDPGGGTPLSLELSEKAPDKFLSVVDVPGLGTVKQGFDGKVGWDSTPNQGVQELTGTMLAAVRRNAQFYRWLRMKELFAKLEVSGTAKVGEREAYVMEAMPPEGFAETFYFDTETGLLLKRDYKLDSPQGMFSFETFYDDYRDVDGIKMPYTLRRVGPDNVLILKFTEIKQNVALDDARFAKPVAP